MGAPPARRPCAGRHRDRHQGREHPPPIGQIDLLHTCRAGQHACQQRCLTSVRRHAAFDHLHRHQLRRLLMAKAELVAPAEQHTGRDSMPPPDRGDGLAMTLGLQQQRDLFLHREAPSPCPSGWFGGGFDISCQGLDALGFLSPSAYICAYRRPRRRVQKRAPVDYDLLRLDQITPPFEAVGRQPQRRRIVAQMQSGPLPGFHMHRPERLCRLPPLVRRGRCKSTLPALSFLGFLSFPLFDLELPGLEVAACQALLAAIGRRRKTALPPCLDMHRPPSPLRPVAEYPPRHRPTSQPERRSHGTSWKRGTTCEHRTVTDRG